MQEIQDRKRLEFTSRLRSEAEGMMRWGAICLFFIALLILSASALIRGEQPQGLCLAGIMGSVAGAVLAFVASSRAYGRVMAKP